MSHAHLYAHTRRTNYTHKDLLPLPLLLTSAIAAAAAAAATTTTTTAAAAAATTTTTRLLHGVRVSSGRFTSQKGLATMDNVEHDVNNTAHIGFRA